MPYFVRPTGEVIVTIGTEIPKVEAVEIQRDLAEYFKLNHGDSLDAASAEAAANQDWAAFASILSGDRDLPVPDEESKRLLPPLGKWQYEVELIAEMGGFATAQGTADRLRQALSQYAAKGFQLVSTFTRDARYVKGETVMLIFGKSVTTERDYRRRFEAEERLRRSVIESLDAEQTEAPDDAA